MYIKVDTSELKRAVSITKKALPKVIIQEERGHLFVKVFKNDTDQKVYFSATNNDLKASVCINAYEASDSFSFTVDPVILEKLLTKSDSNNTVIELNKEDLTIKVYTSDNKKSFNTMQTFPTDKMLTFNTTTDGRKEYYVNRAVLLSALEYGFKYLSPIKDDKKQFDFIIINKGISYAANGMNKMGFFISNEFKDIINYRIRKIMVPYLISNLKLINNDKIALIEDEKNTGISINDSVYFSCLNSTIESPKIMTDLIKGDAPYTKIDKNALKKAMERLTVSSTTAAGITLKLEGTEQATLEMELISNLKNVETLNCTRLNETEYLTTEHVIDYSLFKSIMSSFEDKDIKLYINDTSRFFKINSSGEIETIKYLAIGLGSYSKVVKQ